MKKIILVVLLVILIVAGVVLLQKRKRTISEAPVATPIAYTVRTVLPATRTVSQTSTFLAKLESVKSAEISTKLSGQITELRVRESQQIRSGDLLVHIDDQETIAGLEAQKAQLTSAEKQLNYNQKQHERNLALFKVGGLAREKLEASEVTLNTADAIVKELRQRIIGSENQLDYLNIRAPFAGIVGTIFLRQGDLATPGKPILSLNSLSQKLTFSFMPGPDAILVGQEVRMAGVRAGKITTLYNDAKDGLAVAEVALDKQLNRAHGSYLTLEVVTKTATGCAVPIKSLLHRKQGVSLMLYRQNHFEEKPVRVFVQDKEFALIDPPVDHPLAVASESKLSLLPAVRNIRVISEDKN